MGLFWPIPEVGHPGTPRLHEGGQFHHPDGKARFHAVPYKLSAEVVDDEYPVLLTTGRVVSPVPVRHPDPAHRRARRPVPRAAVRDAPAPRRTARHRRRRPRHRHLRRGTITLPAHVVNTIRPDTVFIPYHWPGDKAANQLTNRAVDPLSKMPEFKVAAVRVERAGGHTDTTDARDLELHGEQP